jgi:hypothetical protein
MTPPVRDTNDDDQIRGFILLCGDPGPWASLEKLIGYLGELRDLPNYREVVEERATIRGHIVRRQQRPFPWDQFEKFGDRLPALMSDDQER